MKTIELQTDVVLCWVTQEILNLEEVERSVSTEAELIAINGVEDVRAVLRVLILLKDDMHLEQFDTIQIYCGGVDLLRVVNLARSADRGSAGTRPSGRSVYVEVNEYRRRLQQVCLPHNLRLLYPARLSDFG